MKKRKLIFLIVAMVLCLTALSGCSQEEMYEHAKNYEENTRQQLQEMSDNAPQQIEGDLKDIEDAMDEASAKGTKYLSDASKKAGIWIIIGSEIVGIIMVIITSKTSAIKLYKMAWMVFIIGIPVMTVIAIYGLAFLASWFM